VAQTKLRLPVQIRGIPGSTTQNALVAWGDAYGNSVLNSLVTVDGSGNLTTPASFKSDGVAKIKEQTGTPSPLAGYGFFYFKSDNKPYALGDDGTEYALGGGGKFDKEVVSFSPDDTYPASDVAVNGLLRAVAFPGAANSITWAQFTLDSGSLQAAVDIKFQIAYSMSNSETSKKVSLNADVWVFADGNAPGKVANVTALEDEITVPNDDQIDILALTNIKVPAAHVASAGQVVVVKLWRDVAGATPAHSGDFRLVSLRAYQT
jgi:hypothetical protein